ncbi:hypothetical protein [Paracoccus sp. (in: a-proteobacteria)]|uniref:hypothetical protein n=1 Tax=Paracoccus sp. TaxID=267 RepID=UPI00396CD8A0
MAVLLDSRRNRELLDQAMRHMLLGRDVVLLALQAALSPVQGQGCDCVADPDSCLAGLEPGNDMVGDVGGLRDAALPSIGLDQKLALNLN